MSHFRVFWRVGLSARSMSACVGSDDVTVCFNTEPVSVNYANGVTITVNGVAATFTAAVDKKCVIYTLTSQLPIALGDVIVWTYEAASGDYADANGNLLADSTKTLTVACPSIPREDWWADLLIDLYDSNGAYTFARQDGATVITAPDDLVEAALDQEARMQRARPVRNRQAYPAPTWQNTIGATDIVPNVPDVFGGTDAVRFTVDNTLVIFGRNDGLNVNDGDEIRQSYYVRRVSGTGQLRMATGEDNSGTSHFVVDPTDSWQRVCDQNVTTVADSANSLVGCLGSGFTIGDIFEICCAQKEVVTGMTNQNPSEFVPVGTGVDNGIGTADGVQYFDTENNHQVDPNNHVITVGNPVPLPEPDGVLIEESRQNIQPDQATLDPATSWVTPVRASVSSNPVVLPNGRTGTANELVEDGTSGTHYTYNTTGILGNSIEYVVMAKMKRGVGTRNAGFRNSGAYAGLDGDVVFDLGAGTIAKQDAAWTGAGMILVADWWICWAVATSANPPSAAPMQLHMFNGTTLSYAGDGVSSILFGDSNIQDGDFYTSFIDGLDAVRNADFLGYVPASYQDDITLYLEFVLSSQSDVSGIVRYLMCVGIDSANMASFSISAAGFAAVTRVSSGGGFALANGSDNQVLQPGLHKICGVFDADLSLVRGYIDGRTITMDAPIGTGAAIAATSATIGRRIGNDDQFANCNIKKPKGWFGHLTEEQCIALTTL